MRLDLGTGSTWIWTSMTPSSITRLKRCVWTWEQARLGFGPLWPQVLLLDSKYAFGPGEQARLGFGPRDAKFMRYALHKLYELVECLTGKENLLEFSNRLKRCAWPWLRRWTRNWNSRTPRFKSNPLHMLFDLVVGIIRKANLVLYSVHSKYTSGRGKDARTGFGPLEPRVYDLRPPQGVRCIGGHNSYQ